MEEHFDALVEHRPDSRMARVWSAFGDDVRRGAALRADLAGLGLQARALDTACSPRRFLTLSRRHVTHRLPYFYALSPHGPSPYRETWVRLDGLRREIRAPTLHRDVCGAFGNDHGPFGVERVLISTALTRH
jgi:hypothetical protein